MSSALIPLIVYLNSRKRKSTGISFIDSTRITEKFWFKASPFKGIINKNFHDSSILSVFKER